MDKNKSVRKLGESVCDYCGITFKKPLSEIKRNEKLNRKNFCSRTCVGKNNVKNFGDGKNRYDISKHCFHLVNEYTGLKRYLNRIKSKHIECDIDFEYLKELWDKQNICIYTGVKLVLPRGKGTKNPLYTASLDRIESNKGYVKGNLQFISITANHAKNTMTHEQMLKFCDLIYENKKPLPE